MSTIRRQFAIASLFLVAAASSSRGVAIATYQFTSGPDEVPTATNATLTGFTRVGTTVQSAGGAFNSAGWATGTGLDGNKYVSFTITPAQGFQLNLQSLVFGSQKSGTGPSNGAVGVVVNGTNTVGGLFAPPTALANSTDDFADFSTTGPVEFRFYGWGAGSTGGTLRFDNVAINGTVTAVQAATPQVVTVTNAGGPGSYLPTFAPATSGASGVTANGFLSGDAGLAQFVLGFSAGDVNSLTAASFGGESSLQTFTSYAALLAAAPWVSADVGTGSLNTLSSFVLLTAPISSGSAAITYDNLAGMTLARVAVVPEPAATSALLLPGALLLRRSR